MDVPADRACAAGHRRGSGLADHFQERRHVEAARHTGTACCLGPGNGAGRARAAYSHRRGSGASGQARGRYGPGRADSHHCERTSARGRRLAASGSGRGRTAPRRPHACAGRGAGHPLRGRHPGGACAGRSAGAGKAHAHQGRAAHHPHAQRAPPPAKRPPEIRTGGGGALRRARRGGRGNTACRDCRDCRDCADIRKDSRGGPAAGRRARTWGNAREHGRCANIFWRNIMQHTLIAVFDNRNDAQAAKDELYAAGFAGAEIRHNEAAGSSATAAAGTSPAGGTAAGTAPNDTGFGAGIRHFFADLFGVDDSQGSRYADLVARGQHVLTLVTMSEHEVERAADIVERHGPVDIDEESGGQAVPGGQLAGGAAAAAGAMGAGLAAGMSQQSAAGSVQGSIGGQGSAQGGMPGSQPQGDLSGQQGSRQRAEGTVLPVVEEELRVGKRQVQRGGVCIFQRVVETPVHESLTMREEHISIERRPVDQPISAAEVASFEDKSIELRETAEEAVVEKSARVVEEVVVGKQVSEHEQQIADTVRRTEVEMEQLGGGAAGTGSTKDSAMLGADDNASFRQHYEANYGGSGRGYQDYLPAYSYGSTMAAADHYRSKAWNDVEPSLRQDWESRHPGSAWEHFKAAIRHGWDKIRG